MARRKGQHGFETMLAFALQKYSNCSQASQATLFVYGYCHLQRKNKPVFLCCEAIQAMM